jgi:hypothetical protein
MHMGMKTATPMGSHTGSHTGEPKKGTREMRKLILASALILAAIVPAKSQQETSFNAEQQKAILWLLKNWDAVKADMDRADLHAGRKLRVDEHISRWFPFDPTTAHFDRLRMQRNGEVIR